jgi:hypothetical protein
MISPSLRAEVGARLDLLAFVEQAITNNPDASEQDVVDLAVQTDACADRWPELGPCVGRLAGEMYQVTKPHQERQ